MIDFGIGFIAGILTGISILFIFAYAHSSRIEVDGSKIWVWFDSIEGNAVSIESEGGKIRLFFATRPAYYILELNIDEFRKFRDAINMFDRKFHGEKNE